MRREDFERVVEEEYARLPAAIRQRIENVQLVILPRPTRRQRREEGGDLLGLYVGVPLDSRATGPGVALPDRIYLFQEPIEAEAGEGRSGVRRVVRETLLHEIAHHFGFSETEVETWEEELS